MLTYFSERIGAEAWRSTNCIAQKSDAIFMAADGRSVLALHPALNREAWQSAVLAEVSRAGEPLLKVRAESVISRDSELRIVGQKVHWMQGAAGEPGPTPGLSTRGDAVVFTRIDGTEMAMDFEGRVTRVESVERTRPSAPAAAAQTSPQASSLDGQSTLRSPNPLYAPSSAANVGPARGGPATLPHMYGVNERDRVAAQAAACERDRAFCIDTATNGKLDETQYKLHDDRSQGVVTHSTDSSGNRIPMQNLVR